MTFLISQARFCVDLMLAFVLLGLMLSGCRSGADNSEATLPGTARTSSTLPSQVDKQTFGYRLTPAPLQEATTQPRKQPPFMLLAAGSRNARIVDRERNVIRKAPDGSTIFSFEMGPNQERVLLYFGSAKYTVASTDSLEDIVSLPVRPDGFEDATGFSWAMLDDDHLLGQADLPSTDTAGKTAADIEALLPRGTLLYVYVLESGALVPVKIDDTLPHVFSILDVYDGYITLLSYDEERIGATIVRASGQ